MTLRGAVNKRSEKEKAPMEDAEKKGSKDVSLGKSALTDDLTGSHI